MYWSFNEMKTTLPPWEEDHGGRRGGGPMKETYTA